MDLVQSVLIFMTAMLIWLGLVGFIAYQIGMIRSKNTTTLCLMNLTAFMIVWLIYLTYGHKGVVQPQVFMNGLMVQLHQALTMNVFTSAAPREISKITMLLQSFAVITSLMIVVGATAERLKLWPFIVFSTVFAGILYPLQAHWLWGGGFLYQIGFIDQSGAGLIFLTGGLAGLIGSYRLGPRAGKYSTVCTMPLRASQIPFVAMGGGLTALALALQSATSMIHMQPGLSLDTVVEGLIASLLAGAAGFMTTLLINRFLTGLSDITIAVNGLFAGIAACAADPFHFDTGGSLTLGFAAGILCLVSLRLFERCKIDDPCGVAPSFLSGGLLGLLAVVGVQNYEELSKRFDHPWHWYNQLYTQLGGTLVLILWVTLLSVALWYLLDYLFGLRPSAIEEDLGLDALDCGTQAYPEFTHSGK